VLVEIPTNYQTQLVEAGGCMVQADISNEHSKIRVLIVDDISETRETLQKTLWLEADIQVVGAVSTGEQAVEIAVEQQPDVVLMDFILPGIDGRVATEQILQHVPSTQIIMMSVHGEADYFRRSMMAGVREFLVKPFSGYELVQSIRRVFQKGEG
jgi:pilus assembly protein CpaE